MSTRFSEEQLNAFVDGELAAAEREEVLAAGNSDPEIAQRLCALRDGKDLLRHAYDRNVLPAPRRAPRARSRWTRALAAGVLLAFGIVVGAQLQRVPLPSAKALPGWASHFFVSQPGRILVHLDHADPEHMEAALDLVGAYLEKNGSAHVEVVVNNRGLDMLRADRTPFAGRIAELEYRYDNVVFVACERAIARFEQEGEQVTILPQAVRTRNAIAHIAERVQGGWTYIKV